MIDLCLQGPVCCGLVLPCLDMVQRVGGVCVSDPPHPS